MIVVFGSINLDLVATVPRLPRAGETLAGHDFRASPGGKGANQALAARRAGADVALYGCVGHDGFALPALDGLQRDGVDLAGVRAVDAPTGVALIHVDDRGENAITVVAGANARATAAQVEAKHLARGATLLLQLEVPLPEVTALAQRARAAGVRVLLNVAPFAPLPDALLHAVDVLIANRGEAQGLAAAAGIAAAPEEFVTAYAARYGATAIVTLGADGAVAAAPGERAHAVRAPKVDVVDTVGAGDAFVGALAAALDRGAALELALRHGVAAGTLACTRHGAQAALPARSAFEDLATTL